MAELVKDGKLGELISTISFGDNPGKASTALFISGSAQPASYPTLDWLRPLIKIPSLLTYFTVTWRD